MTTTAFFRVEMARADSATARNHAALTGLAVRLGGRVAIFIPGESRESRRDLAAVQVPADRARDLVGGLATMPQVGDVRDESHLWTSVA